jgi:hypothetical protein
MSTTYRISQSYRTPTGRISKLIGTGNTLADATDEFIAVAKLTVGTLIGTAVTISTPLASTAPIAFASGDAKKGYLALRKAGTPTLSATVTLKDLAVSYFTKGKIPTSADITAIASSFYDTDGNTGYAFVKGREITVKKGKGRNYKRK